MKLGRLCIDSESISTITDQPNGHFFKEYLVDLDNDEMVELCAKVAKQEAWDEACSLANEEGGFHGCSSYPSNDYSVWVTKSRRGSKLKYDEKSLKKSLAYMNKYDEDDLCGW
jgi:hypothetical protein